MAGVVSVGAVGAGDILRFGLSVDTSYLRRHNRVCPYPVLRHIVAQSRV